MKPEVTVILSLVLLSVAATRWEDVKRPMDSPKYQKIVAKFFNSSSYDGKKITGKVTNGNLANLGDFPYQVYMFLYQSDGTSWLCGGSVMA